MHLRDKKSAHKIKPLVIARMTVPA